MSKTTTKTRNDYSRRTRATGINIQFQVLDEADILRGDIPRSKYIERALLMFNAYVRKNGRIALVQDASSVPTPEHLMTVDSPAFVEVNSPQNPHTTTVLTLEEDAAPVTS